MDKAVQTWFNTYYGRCVGSSTPVREIAGEEDEKKIADEYAVKFLRPMCYIATGKMETPEDKSVLNRALNVIGTGPITDWIYLLNYWVNNEFFTYTGDLTADYGRCVERTRSDMRVVFATIGKDYKDICLHTVNRQTVDDFPYEVFYYPRDMKAHFNGRLLQDVCKKLPSTLSEPEIAMLAAAEARRFITEDDLMTEEIMCPYNHGKDQRFIPITALTPNRPPADYLELCRNLAPAQAQEFPTLFLAVKDYAKHSPVSDAVRNYINIISGSDDLFAGMESTKSAAIDDSAVMDYLREQYGIECQSLGDLTVGPVTAFKNAVTFDESLIEGSAKELFDQVISQSGMAVDTLDEVIIKFCEDNKLSQDCTIKQLIEVINYDVHPTPPTFLDNIATYMSEHNAPVETTFDDVIKGVQHKETDPIDVVMEFIKDNEFYSDEVRNELMNSIVEGVPVNFPTEKEAALAALPKLGLPDDLLSRMLIAVQTDSAVELPKITAESEEPKATGDKGFDAGYVLLKGTREAIFKDPSTPNRMAYTPVLYAFLRLLMCDVSSEIPEVLSALEFRIGQATGDAKALLEKGADLLKSN